MGVSVSITYQTTLKVNTLSALLRNLVYKLTWNYDAVGHLVETLLELPFYK